MTKQISIIIGVEEYRDKKISKVAFARADAEAISDAFDAVGFLKENQTMLLDEYATKTTVDERIKDVFLGITEEDELYFFFAGHGVSSGGRNYLFVYDTDNHNIQNTAVSLQSILDRAKAVDCAKAVFFLDACQSDLLIDESMRSVVTTMSEAELRGFLEEGKHAICFSSSSGFQSSYSSRNMKHGIWTYHLLKALDGTLPASHLKNGTLLTSNGLQNYLAQAVPISLRETFNDKKSQNPKAFGSWEHEFIIADLSELIRARQSSDGFDTKMLVDASLSSQRSMNVKDLHDFEKGHHIPTRANSSATNFINDISRHDLREDVRILSKAIRDEFQYMIGELDTAIDDGTATIIAPAFEYTVSVELDQDNLSKVIWERKLINIKPEMWAGESLSNVFKRQFDTLELDLAQKISVKEVIEGIQRLRSKVIKVDYDDTDLSKCVIEIEGLEATIEVSRNGFSVITERFSQPSTLISLLKRGLEAIAAHAGGTILPRAFGLIATKDKTLPPPNKH